MSEKVEFLSRVILIGVGATIVMDLWALLLRQFGIPSLNFAFLGRWLCHLPEGQWIHESIAKAAPAHHSAHHERMGGSPSRAPHPSLEDSLLFANERVLFEAATRFPFSEQGDWVLYTAIGVEHRQ